MIFLWDNGLLLSFVGTEDEVGSFAEDHNNIIYFFAELDTNHLIGL